MSTKKEVRKEIVYTQLGLVSATQYEVSGYDVDDLCSDRTEAGLIGLQVKNISLTIDPYATKNDKIKSADVKDV